VSDESSEKELADLDLEETGGLYESQLMEFSEEVMENHCDFL
jgi:hypothetical protein